MISYVLNKEINCGDICNNIQKLVVNFQQTNPNSQGVLVIQIRELTDSQEHIEPLRIEYKV